jgi:hypothetical protein
MKNISFCISCVLFVFPLFDFVLLRLAVRKSWLVLELSIAPQICALELGSPAVILDFLGLGFFISVLAFAPDGES